MKTLRDYIDLVENSSVAKQPKQPLLKPLKPVQAVAEDDVEEDAVSTSMGNQTSTASTNSIDSQLDSALSKLSNLEEVSRRDVLKGAGAAALGAAGAGSANAYQYGRYPDGSGVGLNLDDDEFKSLVLGMQLYTLCKKGHIPNQTVCNGISQALGKFAQLKGGRDVLNQLYAQSKSQIDQLEQLPEFKNIVRINIQTAQRTIDNVNAIVEF